MLSSRHPNRLVFQLHGIFETNDLLRAGSLQCFMYSAMATGEEVMRRGLDLMESTNEITD